MRILLADDHQELRETTAELLQELDFEVTAAADGAEAWRAYRAAPEGFALVVTDLAMPEMDGWELSRRILALRPGCPIVFVTTRGRDRRLRALEESGRAAVLAKPFSPEELERAVRRAIAGPQRVSSNDSNTAAEPRADRPATEPAPAPAAGRRRSRRPVRPVLGLAAMAVLGLGFLLYGRLAGPPALPLKPTEQVLRSTAVELADPVGEVDRPPAELRWRALAGAASYRVTLRRIDERVLWTSVSPSTSAVLPPEVHAVLQPGVSFLWEVEAFDPEGRSLARSPATRFRIRLATTSEERLP